MVVRGPVDRYLPEHLPRRGEAGQRAPGAFREGGGPGGQEAEAPPSSRRGQSHEAKPASGVKDAKQRLGGAGWEDSLRKDPGTLQPRKALGTPGSQTAESLWRGGPPVIQAPECPLWTQWKHTQEVGKRRRPPWVNESRDREHMEFGPAVEFQLLE